MTPQPPRFTLFPYTTLFRSLHRPRQSDKCDPENSDSDELPEVAGYPELVSSILGECHSRVVGVRDRKSTRLNSSHTVISYAVFCLKKKKKRKLKSQSTTRRQ